MEEAALKNNDKVQTQLGFMLCNSIGVRPDLTQALYWYQKAANQGNPTALFNLGGMNLRGYGVLKNREKAIQYYQKAASQGLIKAKEVLKVLEEG